MSSCDGVKAHEPRPLAMDKKDDIVLGGIEPDLVSGIPRARVPRPARAENIPFFLFPHHHHS